jgi:hypothetical protein
MESSIAPNEDLHGTIIINYSGRWDSLVINSQIENSNDTFVYSEINSKKVKYPYARLSIFKSELGDGTVIEFTATTKHSPVDRNSNAKFRVSVIQEHKEVASDIVHIKIVKRD